MKKEVCCINRSFESVYFEKWKKVWNHSFSVGKNTSPTQLMHLLGEVRPWPSSGNKTQIFPRMKRAAILRYLKVEVGKLENNKINLSWHGAFEV